MQISRYFFLLALALASFAFALPGSYAAVLCGWIVYSDLAGSLGQPNSSAREVAFFWAPLASAACAALLSVAVTRWASRRWQAVRRPPKVMEVLPRPEQEIRSAEPVAALRAVPSTGQGLIAAITDAAGDDRAATSAPPDAAEPRFAQAIAEHRALFLQLQQIAGGSVPRNDADVAADEPAAPAPYESQRRVA